ncbi:hypothetical protein ASPWEDRAFT_116823 [Aspergillus wentii DTO 134E9]|uniref:Uncharacterized protein n=1 Tax=Aspergillus wentii DTO 134E9 TaxID=1073089 RepID=A0A1L9RAA7_ASPWE|nr:uncharacterized protein ASPWEDRAFT_116823 [Aspergillus wentii DTO 134E9]OJJ31851.1 hypothetical protein ASPWEDRAFT_116823 [Aspergillus wentii DTO 134E9]
MEPTTAEPESFCPSLWDVLKTRHVLQWKVVPGGMPAEIVDLIVDAAEYWPSSVVTMQGSTIIRNDRDRVILKTDPLCYSPKTLSTSSPTTVPHRTIHPCRKIIFSISAHDQGWGGHGDGESIFNGSFTWFDTEIIPFTPFSDQRLEDTNVPERQHFGPDHPNLLPREDKLQSNPIANDETQHYTITWHHLDNIQPDSDEAEEIKLSQGRGRATLDGSQVRGLEIGQSIALWARARFGGWANHVDGASIRVFWSV